MIIAVCFVLGCIVFCFGVICIGDILCALLLAVTAVLFGIRLDCVQYLRNLQNRCCVSLNDCCDSRIVRH